MFDQNQTTGDLTPLFPHEDDFFDSTGNRFLDDVLDDRFVDNGEHFFWLSLGRGEESSSHAGDGNNAFANFHTCPHCSVKTGRKKRSGVERLVGSSAIWLEKHCPIPLLFKEGLGVVMIFRSEFYKSV